MRAASAKNPEAIRAAIDQVGGVAYRQALEKLREGLLSPFMVDGVAGVDKASTSTRQVQEAAEAVSLHAVTDARTSRAPGASTMSARMPPRSVLPPRWSGSVRTSVSSS